MQMSNWTTVALPIATLVIGSALTMAGQALKDRRALERERKTRRAEFLSANFDVHRNAILEMQEIVGDSYRTLLAEKRRRSETGFYAFFDAQPLQGLAEGTLAAWACYEELVRITEDETLTREEKTAIATNIANSLFERSQSLSSESAEYAAALKVHLEAMYPFWESHINTMSKLRLRMARSGSNSVVLLGEKYITAVIKWSEQFSSGERCEELARSTTECRRDLDRALANALKYGPYNEMDQRRTERHGVRRTPSRSSSSSS